MGGPLHRSDLICFNFIMVKSNLIFPAEYNGAISTSSMINFAIVKISDRILMLRLRL